MGFSKPPDTIPVAMEYKRLPDGYEVKGDFFWPEERPENTYTIETANVISITLDKFTPIRPYVVKWVVEAGNGQVGTESVIERIFGTEMLGAMRRAIEMRGLVLTHYDPRDHASRLELLGLQVHSPSTPEAIGELAKHMLINEIGQASGTVTDDLRGDASNLPPAA
jgi:hypothetical protein